MATVPNMPRVEDPHENRRMAHTRLRRRLLDGVFQADLEDRILEHLGSQRTRMTGPPDLSGMFFGSLCRELSTLYLSPPIVHHQRKTATRTLSAAVAAAGLWPAMLRYQSWVVGCRDYAIRADVAADGGLTYRAVAPDCLVGDAPVDRPDQPYRLSELRERDGVWTWDVFDAKDIDAPRYSVREAIEGKDPLDCPLWGEQPDETWPSLYRTSDGVPVVPYVLHHAEVMTDRLWDPWAWLTVVEGSLTHAVLLSFWLHLVRDASWPQRYSIDLQLWGEGVDGDAADRLGEVVTDPASLLRFIATPDARSPTAGQFAPGGDPASTLTAIDNYAARIAQDAGVSTSDMQRMSGDPRSGYAISLSNEGKRAAQRRFAAPFQLADQRLMALSAVLLNRANNLDLPEAGWEVAYAPIPLSPEELRSRREHALELYDRGLATRVHTYMALHPGVSRDRAVAELKEIDIERGATDDAGPSTTNASPREIAEMLQKLYLSVGTVITPEEARDVMNRAGAQLEGDPVLVGKPSPATAAMTTEDDDE